MEAPPKQEWFWTVPVESRRRAFGQLLYFLLWVAVTGIAAWLTPSPHGHGTHTQLGLAPCPSILLFDRPCPGCGLTTAFAWTVRGRLDLAFESHAMGSLLYLVFTASAWYGFAGWLKRRKWDSGRRLFWAASAFTLALLIYGWVRFALVKEDSPMSIANQVHREFSPHP
ncbi:MAG: DUF2752 domain-containing protein [Fimbriimonadaceae bacterium]|nr:DUF2752 domain-containing protein [Fimbriimonadaceae bacterium]